MILYQNNKHRIKKIILCEVPTHIIIKRNEAADNAAKQAIDIPGMTTIRLPDVDYNLTIRSGKIIVSN